MLARDEPSGATTARSSWRAWASRVARRAPQTHSCTSLGPLRWVFVLLCTCVLWCWCWFVTSVPPPFASCARPGCRTGHIAVCLTLTALVVCDVSAPQHGTPTQLPYLTRLSAAHTGHGSRLWQLRLWRLREGREGVRCSTRQHMSIARTLQPRPTSLLVAHSAIVRYERRTKRQRDRR